jgi:hypothetical protein
MGSRQRQENVERVRLFSLKQVWILSENGGNISQF